eukprot:3192026-Pleurochrysis_carterae.AAC.1
MDPQQRLMLEHGYAALHAHGETKASLLGAKVGVFVGVWACEFADVLRLSLPADSVYAVSASSCSVLVGR